MSSASLSFDVSQVVRQNSAAVELVVAQTVMRQLLASLNTLHGAGMVHRDIKPQVRPTHLCCCCVDQLSWAWAENLRASQYSGHGPYAGAL